MNEQALEHFDTKKTKTQLAAGRRGEHARAAPGRVERDNQGEARRPNTTSNGGLHLEIRRLRIKNRYKYDVLIDQTTWPACLDICFSC